MSVWLYFAHLTVSSTCLSRRLSCFCFLVFHLNGNMYQNALAGRMRLCSVSALSHEVPLMHSMTELQSAGFGSWKVLWRALRGYAASWSWIGPFEMNCTSDVNDSRRIRCVVPNIMRFELILNSSTASKNRHHLLNTLMYFKPCFFLGT